MQKNVFLRDNRQQQSRCFLNIFNWLYWLNEYFQIHREIRGWLFNGSEAGTFHAQIKGFYAD
jgi:hypothetical protein